MYMLRKTRPVNFDREDATLSATLASYRFQDLNVEVASELHDIFRVSLAACHRYSAWAPAYLNLQVRCAVISRFIEPYDQCFPSDAFGIGSRK